MPHFFVNLYEQKGAKWSQKPFYAKKALWDLIQPTTQFEWFWVCFFHWFRTPVQNFDSGLFKFKLKIAKIQYRNFLLLMTSPV